MANNRRKYFRRTRKSRMRELKQSPTGLLSLASALAAVIFFAVSVIRSYQASGEADFSVGSFGLIGLILALGAWILGALCLREKNVRPFPPKTGITLGVILTLALGGMYTYGFIW